MLNTIPVRVCIEELLINAYLGVHRSEQKKRKKIPVYLEFEYDHPAVDSLAAAVDYRDVRNAVLAAVEGQRFCLVETMASTILDAVKNDPRVTRALIRVSKPKALKLAKSVAVMVEWTRAKQ